MKSKLFIFKNDSFNLVSTFIPGFKGTLGFFYDTWETELGRGSQSGRWLALLRAWLKWLRCTNKTTTLTDSREAYHPLRGCLTAGEGCVCRAYPTEVTHILCVSFPLYHLIAEIHSLTTLSIWIIHLIWFLIAKESLTKVPSKLLENGKQNVSINQ